jgi:hypothetical protein
MEDFLIARKRKARHASNHQCPSTDSVTVTTTAFKSSSSLELRSFTPGCVLPLPGWTKALSPEGHELDHKWRVPKEMVGRRLSQEEAKRSWLRSNRNVRAEHLQQVAAGRLIIVDDQHLLIKVQRPLGDAKGPFRPSRGESTRADVHLYLAGARGHAAGIYNGAKVRTKAGSLEPLPDLLDVNVEPPPSG